MQKITLKIDGMMCGMCESHINDAIRREYRVKKVTSSHSKEETVIITGEDIPQESLAKTIQNMGYHLLSCRSEPYEKKGFFARRGK